MLNNFNIVFDGNFLFHKTKTIYQSYKRADTITALFKETENQAEFLRKIVMDFCFVMNVMPKASRVVVTFDASNCWRKDFYPLYKQRKEKSEEDKEGWTIFFDIMEKFKRLLIKRGFIVSCIDTMEGDDLCFFWNEYLRYNKQEVLIVSGDRDLTQLVSSKMTSVYDNKSTARKLFVFDKNLYTDKFTKEFLTIEEVNQSDFLFKKMLLGDSGDNVPNVARGVGEVTVEKALSLAKEMNLVQLDYSDQAYLADIAVIVNHVCKNTVELEVMRALERNVKLMWLDNSVYTPDQYITAMEHIKAVKNDFTYEKEYNMSTFLKP